MLLPRTLASVVLLLLPLTALGCGPGRGGIRRRGARKLSPLVYKQHVPNFSERSLAASGLPEGPVDRLSERFRHLVPNYNPDIIFKDEESTGADRLMTQRCKEKLNTLAISVMNLWPGVQLRVTEGWDEDLHHSAKSLHYEGRAVDLTTSDRDRKKYGMLARLAVEAGFDWVYYESRSHIHASCKSEASGPDKGGGCFHGDSTVMTSTGERKRMSDLLIGDEVLAVQSDGQYVFSPILLFLDRDPDSEARQFVTLMTDSGHEITLTPTHLVYVAKNEDYDEEYYDDSHKEEDVHATKKEYTDFVATYAGSVTPGDQLLVRTSDGQLLAATVVSAHTRPLSGVFAPLTAQGNLVVDGVLASSYAVVDSQAVAHAAFAPVRLYHSLVNWIWPPSGDDQTAQAKGVHWYADLLYSVARSVMPNHLK